MTIIEEANDRIDTVDRTVAELQDKVEVINGGWKRLTDSNEEMNQRIASVEKELSSMIRILNRLESHVIGDKGKSVASSAPSNSQVHFDSPRNELGTEELVQGLRQLRLEDISKWIKQNSLKQENQVHLRGTDHEYTLHLKN
ncbi:hypothetical protein Bca4012_042710 [Brassica carinata]|uniref:Uncharacterized protein n=1 Tax=Brassica carinata TaxID=52824 RepID=A0A8X7UFT4_BRACI|nr:hypothetical protein Bca52824_059574 [Brassica carinata]